jgi:hypothetical protein
MSLTSPSAFVDQLDLRTAVIEMVGTAQIVDVFPRLVTLAESGFNRDLKTRQRMSSEALTFTSGSAPLPDDYWEMIGVFDADGCEYVAQPPQSTMANTAFYSIDAGNIVCPLAVAGLTAYFYTKIPSISTSLDSSNWLLQRYPDVYFYGVGFRAALHLKDADLAQAVKGLLDDEMTSVMADDNRSRYARARVRIQGATP